LANPGDIIGICTVAISCNDLTVHQLSMIPGCGLGGNVIPKD